VPSRKIGSKWISPLWMIVATITLIGTQGCGSKDEHSRDATTAKTQTLRRGLGGEPASLDPAAAGDTYSNEVIADLYEGLTAESPDGTVVPGVAASWKVNAAGTEYTFQLRSDAKWSNGAPVRAEDFVRSWRRVVDPKSASPVADNLRLIAGASEIIAGRAAPATLGVSAPRDDLLVVNLEKPAPYFLQVLTHASTFPVYSDTAAKSHDGQLLVSNGAYSLSDWTPGNELHLLKNPMYWDREHVQVARVTYVPVPDESSELRQYRAGQLDVTYNVPSSDLPMIRREHPKELFVWPFLASAYYGFNLRKGPFQGNVALRKSLDMAVDRKKLLESILPFGQRAAYGFVPPGAWNYTPQSFEWAEMSDPERLSAAQRLYREAGYSVKKPLRIRLLFNSSPNIKQMAIAIASMWHEGLGIEVELVDEEFRVFLDSQKDASRWDVIRLGWNADYNDAVSFLSIFRTGSPNNQMGYESTRFDALLAQAESIANDEERRAVLEAAERLLLSDYPVIPLYFYSSKRLIQTYVKGAAGNPLNRLYSKHLTLLER
jgi:oligopeptide transport system substrate-binding protein